MKQDLRFSQRCCWRFKQSGILARCCNDRCSPADVEQDRSAGNVRLQEGRSCIMLHVTSGPEATCDAVSPSNNGVLFRNLQQRCKLLFCIPVTVNRSTWRHTPEDLDLHFWTDCQHGKEIRLGLNIEVSGSGRGQVSITCLQWNWH